MRICCIITSQYNYNISPTESRNNDRSKIIFQLIGIPLSELRITKYNDNMEIFLHFSITVVYKFIGHPEDS